ncbi:MAG: SecE subunit of protein translocation complex [Acidobacteriales bacterium]|nr:SecE subunit of protein translocation complex [Terriglobales bacterium]
MASRTATAVSVDAKGVGGKVVGWWDQSRSFLNDVRTEMRKVTSPSFKEVQATTGVVIVTVALFAIYFYGVDRVIGFFIDNLFQMAKKA